MYYEKATLHGNYNLQYCCGIWGNSRKKTLLPLILAQKRSIKSAYGLDFRASVQPTRKAQKILSLKHLVDSNLALQAHKIIHKTAPNSVQEDVILDLNPRRPKTMIIPRALTSETLTLPYQQMPKIWNSLSLR